MKNRIVLKFLFAALLFPVFQIQARTPDFEWARRAGGPEAVIEISSKVLLPAEVDSISQLNNSLKYHQIKFQDNGIGFDQKFATQIFTIFKRLNARNRYEGTGIGLALCNKIVENHNGFIRAQSEENKGTTFEIYLPA